MKTYNDYPQEASNNAKRALEWVEKNGWGSWGTPVGKKRARQLANREPISRDTIARMAAFERHRQHSKGKFGDGCGPLMWAAWGGDAGIEWSKRKLKEIDNKKYFGFDVYKVETNIEFLSKSVIEKLLEAFEKDKVYDMNNRQFNDYFGYSAPINEVQNSTYNVYVEGIGPVELKTSNYFPLSPTSQTRLVNRNVYDFTQAKSYYTSKKLIDVSKQVTNIDDFRLKSYDLLDKYYNEFGNVELDLMVRKVESAKQFSDWAADENVSLLQYRTLGDDRVRASHNQLNGITRPKTDVFWAKYSAPIEWNCRCRVVPVKSGLTDKPKARDLMITESKVNKEIRYSTFHMLKENSIRSLIGNQHPYFELYNRYYGFNK